MEKTQGISQPVSIMDSETLTNSTVYNAFRSERSNALLLVNLLLLQDICIMSLFQLVAVIKSTVCRV